MNTTSLIFAFAIGGCLVILAWIIDRGAARHNHWSPSKRRVARWFFFSLALVAGIFVYFTDAGLRNVTLFEVEGPWAETGDRVWVVKVEHDGVAHDLLVAPDVLALENARDPITLSVHFGPADGESLLDEAVQFEVGRRSGKSARMSWRSKSFTIVPKTKGPHQLKINALDGVPPRLHVRIADPEKQNGKRAPGY